MGRRLAQEGRARDEVGTRRAPHNAAHMFMVINPTLHLVVRRKAHFPFARGTLWLHFLGQSVRVFLYVPEKGKEWYGRLACQERSWRKVVENGTRGV